MFKHSMITAIYYFIYVTVAFFLAAYLTKIGVTQVTAGYLNGLGILFFVISTLIFGYLLDNFIKTKRLFIISVFLSIVSFILLIIAQTIILNIVAYFLIWIFFMPQTALIDNLILNDMVITKYSQIRAYGSFGAAIAYLLNSIVLFRLNFEYIFFINIIGLIIILILLYFIVEKERVADDRMSYKEGLRSIMNNKIILIILIVTFLTYGTLSADDAFNYNFETMEVGLNGLIIGIVGFISILIEFFLMRNYQKLTYKINYQNILIFVTAILCGIFLTKALFFDFKILIIISDIVLGIFVGFFVPTAINLINSNTEKNVRATVINIYQILIKVGGVFVGYLTTIYYSFNSVYHSIYYLHFTILLLTLILLIFIFKIKRQKV